MLFRSLRLFLVLFFLLPAVLKGQNGYSVTTGARGMAMGQVSMGFKDVQSSFGNQAGLAFVRRPSAIIFAEQRFLLADISNFAAAFAYPTRSGTFALSMQYFGFEAYNEQKIGIAYGRQLFERVALGGQIDLINTRITEYGSRMLATFELGFHAGLVENLALVGHIFSPIRVEVTEGEELPTVLGIGLVYEASEKLLLMGEVQKDIDFKMNIKAGIEYLIYEGLRLRAGTGSQPSTFSFGLGYEWTNGLQINLASNYHQTLGFSPAFGLQYRAPKK